MRAAACGVRRAVPAAACWVLSAVLGAACGVPGAECGVLSAGCGGLSATLQAQAPPAQSAAAQPVLPEDKGVDVVRSHRPRNLPVPNTHIGTPAARSRMPTGMIEIGIRPMSPDGWPMIGPTGEGVLVAAGHSRDGWLMAPITAEIITAYVFGAEIQPDWAALSPERFETK